MASKKEGTGKKVVGGIALGLVLILLGGVAGGLLQHHYKWGEDEPTVEEPEDPKDEDSTGGTVIGESTGNGVKLMSAKIAKEDYAANGISPLAETAYQLTASIEPMDATNQEVDWSVSFVNASSAWATGKSVTDYVTVTPTEDGARTATVANLGAFGEQIKVTVTSRDNPEVTAECTVDYAKRLTSATVSIGGDTTIVCSSEGTEYEVSLTETYSEGTIESSTTITGATIELTTEFKDAIEETNPTILENLVTKTIGITSGFTSDEDFIVGFFASSDYGFPSKTQSFFKNGFKKQALEFEGSQAIIKVSCENSYNDEVYKTDTATLEVRFNTEALKTGVTGVTIVGDGSIIF